MSETMHRKVVARTVPPTIFAALDKTGMGMAKTTKDEKTSDNRSSCRHGNAKAAEPRDNSNCCVIHGGQCCLGEITAYVLMTSIDLSTSVADALADSG
jgi:hypothetical protein